MHLKKKPLIFDGAMGTYYVSAGKSKSLKCELANIYDSETILGIHREYVKAGARAIRTNTFAANEYYLECDWKTTKEVIEKGYRLAHEAAKDTDIIVFADIGPISVPDLSDLFEEYKREIDLFIELGASSFIFETFSNDTAVLKLSKYIKEINPNSFILASYAISPEGFTRDGASGSALIKRASESPDIDACGFNCYSGPYHLMKYIKNLDISNKSISIMPNSGYPEILSRRTFFNGNKEYFSDIMMEIIKSGVSIIGGCCGTTPEFIKEIVGKLQDINENLSAAETGRKAESKRKKISSNLILKKINDGKKVIAVELDPPSDTNIDSFFENAKILKKHNVDAITIADCPIARARVDSSLLACKLKREYGINSIPHMTCRDRNINATKALLLGLSIEGVNNVLLVTGDPIPSNQREEIKGMTGFNSARLAEYVTNLNETVFSSPFNICGALNINSNNFAGQISHARKKIESGISMFLTQPVLTEQAVKNIEIARNELKSKILGGIMPVVSYKNACFMNNEIPGIKVSEEIIEIYRHADKGEAFRLAVDISVKYAERIYPHVDGFYIITPFNRADIIVEIIKKLDDLIASS